MSRSGNYETTHSIHCASNCNNVAFTGIEGFSLIGRPIGYSFSMINGLVSDDPNIKAAWASIHKAREVPTLEEIIAFYVEKLKR